MEFAVYIRHVLTQEMDLLYFAKYRPIFTAMADPENLKRGKKSEGRDTMNTFK